MAVEAVKVTAFLIECPYCHFRHLLLEPFSSLWSCDSCEETFPVSCEGLPNGSKDDVETWFTPHDI